MRMFLYLFLLLPVLAMAEPPCPGCGDALSNTSSSGATASQGNRQAINFNSGSGAQTIETVPSVSLFTPMSTAHCYVTVGAGASALGAGAAINASFRDYSCYLQELGKAQASLAIVSYNMGAKIEGIRHAQAAQQLIGCSDPNAYIVLKANGVPCPVEPDPRWFGDMLVGGMPDRVVRQHPDYHPATYQVREPAPIAPPAVLPPADAERERDRRLREFLKK